MVTSASGWMGGEASSGDAAVFTGLEASMEKLEAWQ
jgi:hypothetical protein